MTATDPEVSRTTHDAARTRDWRFLRRPRWLAAHVLALLLLVTFVNMGLWQLRRHAERTELNALLTERLDAPPVPVADAVAGAASPAELAYRPATAHGSYRTADEVLVGPLSRDGRPGFTLLTPLQTAEGAVLWVDRGWVPYDADLDPPVAVAAPPPGTVAVTGVLRESLLAGDQAVRRPDGTLRLIPRPDLDLLSELVGAAPAHPVWLQRSAQDPPDPGGLPLPSELPGPEEGPHLAYAVQWFAFAAVGLVGYPVLLRRTAAR